ncbi:MAG: hypothetical protein IH939_08340 [Acidobacteria bacterium]|nr:hypothetical protein [Acidobacteriota bacterium]
MSLLGCKPNGLSEFSFYSFYGGYDVPAEHAGSLSFQEWLDCWHGELSILLHEHPTRDSDPIPTETLEAVAHDINALLSTGRTVVLVDSGGQERTGKVCKYMGAVEDSSNTP